MTLVPFPPRAVPPLWPGYSVIVADPPWRFHNWSEKGRKKAASQHYETMKLDDIKALPVGQIAEWDCLLLLWTCGWAMATGQAHEVARAWGFEPTTELVWRKLTANGRRRMGPGYWARTLHEPVLLCTKGKPNLGLDRRGRAIRIKAFPSVFDGVAREHSRKPDEFYELVRAHTPGLRRIELFSRESRQGFDAWGDQLRMFDEPVIEGGQVGHQSGTSAGGGHVPHDQPPAPILQPITENARVRDVLD